MNDAETYAVICERGGLADFSWRAKFRLTGTDRVRFLNGQISNRVRDLEPGEARRACVMTAKGRMCADVVYSATPEALRLDAERELRESLAERIERYIIADDVELVDVTDELRIFHAFGPAVEFARPVAAGHGFVRSDRLGRDGIDILLPTAVADEVWERLRREIPVLNAQLIELLRIEAGIPRWGAELDEATIPVEAGLDRTAIDYNKGCYIGQEVISRLKSLGHVNRELRGFVPVSEVSTLHPPLLRSGTPLFVPGGNAKEAGRITSVAYSFALLRPVALGYVRRGVTATRLLARNPGEPEETAVELEVRPLPIIS